MVIREFFYRRGGHEAGARPGRTRSIRVTLLALLLVPLVALMLLWGFLASITLGSALTELHYNQVIPEEAAATGRLLAGLEQERLRTFLWLSSPRRAPVSELTAVRRADDTAIAAYERETGPLRVAMRGLKLDAITRIRAAADTGELTAPAVFQEFSGVIDALWNALGSTQQADATQYRETLAATAAGRAVEQFTRDIAITAAAAVDHGRLSAADQALFVQAEASQDVLLGQAVSESSGQFHATLLRLSTSPLYRQLTVLEAQIAAGTGRAQQSALRGWNPLARAWLSKLNGAATADSAQLSSLAAVTGRKLLLEAVLAGGAGLLAVAASMFLMVRFGRGIRRELTGLHDSAQSMAEERLPMVVERLRNGEDVDVAAESPPLRAGRITEIASVAQAFSAVQRTAVSAAVGQADLRKGIGQVFLNLSLRNQSLLHRQLGMLDSMERATNDPAALADLFRLDHLTTRMRRHAEGLIILSGATPARGWREPVPVVDVLRAAIAEVEDYVRVDVTSESPDAVAGATVNDVIHLVAELVENATTFSPPNTRVEIRADLVGRGLAMEIEDRGLGLTVSELALINTKLASPREFDLANSDRLGLFVVGQLADRHDIKVSLRGSAYGGTIAVVLLPRSIIASDGEAGPAVAGLPGQPARVNGTRRPAVTAAPAFGLTGRPRFAAAPPQGQRGPAQGQRGPAAAPRPTPDQPSWDVPAGAGAAPTADASEYRSPWEPPPRPEPSTRPPWGAPARGTGPASAAAPQLGPAAAPQPERARRPVSDGTHRGLPRRVKQASLAPQLRNRAAPPSAAQSAGAPAGRAPEDTRTMMSALQLGWQHGRVDDLDFPDDDWPGGTPGAADGNEGEGS